MRFSIAFIFKTLIVGALAAPIALKPNVRKLPQYCYYAQIWRIIYFRSRSGKPGYPWGIPMAWAPEAIPCAWTMENKLMTHSRSHAKTPVRFFLFSLTYFSIMSFSARDVQSQTSRCRTWIRMAGHGLQEPRQRELQNGDPRRVWLAIDYCRIELRLTHLSQSHLSHPPI